MRGKRKSIRLKDYDYMQVGAYYLTVCTHDRKCIFGGIKDGKMVLNECGKIADKCWNDIPVHFPHVGLDEYVVMPNHVHGIINIVNNVNVGANNYSPLQQQSPSQSVKPINRPHGTSKTMGSVIRGFKIGVTKSIRQMTGMDNIWQRNYYEHVIRNEHDLTCIREYILTNPILWSKDEYYIDA